MSAIELRSEGNLPPPDVPVTPEMQVRIEAVSAMIQKAAATQLHVLLVNEHERRAILSGLRRARIEISSAMRRQKRDGWTPEPGKHDSLPLRMRTIEGLLKRYER